MDWLHAAGLIRQFSKSCSSFLLHVLSKFGWIRPKICSPRCFLAWGEFGGVFGVCAEPSEACEAPECSDSIVVHVISCHCKVLFKELVPMLLQHSFPLTGLT